MITFHVETWVGYYNDPQRAALWQEHYEYLAQAHDYQMPMSPDVASYVAMAASGQLEIIVARERGVMVGYSLFVVRRHLHYAALCAFEDSYFMTARCRRGGAGWRLISATLDRIWARGAQRGYFMTKEFASVAVLLQRLGGRKMDEVFVFDNPGQR